MKFLKFMPVVATVFLLASPAVFAQDASDEWNAINKQVMKLYSEGDYKQAEGLARKALEIAEKNTALDRRILPASLNNLAELYASQGQYTQAEPLYKRSLMINEKDFGPEHPDVAMSLNNVAGLYVSEGQYAQAEPLYQRALAIREKALGPDDPDVAVSLNNIAKLYRSQGRYSKAEPLYQRALAIFEKALGPDHPLVATSLNNLAFLYVTQEQYTQAEPLYRRALAIDEKALGPDHPSVAGILNSLALLYYSQGQYDQAEPLYQRALAIDEKAYGPDHPDVAADLNLLAEMYRSEGQYAHAEPLYQRALAIKERALAPEHPDVATILNNLAALYYSQSQLTLAEPLYQRSLAIREKALGPDHPDVAASLNNLALLYDSQGQFAQSEPLYKRSLAINEKTLGPDHSVVATSLNNLARLYYFQGKFALAAPLFARALTIDEKVLGADHPKVSTDLNNLAALYYSQGEFVQAEPLTKRALAIREKTLGPTHPDVAVSLINLAELYDHQARYPEALTTVRRATAILRTRFVNDAPDDRSGGLLAEQHSQRNDFLAHVGILSHVDTKASDHVTLAAEGFEVAQLARASSVGQSVAQMAARFAQRGDALAELVRAQQDTRNQLTRADKALLDALSQPPDKHNGTVEGTLRKSIEDLGHQLDAQNKTIGARFPEYQALISQAPVSAVEVQKLLHPDEALLVYTVADEQSYAWVVRPDRVSFHTLAIGQKDLDTQVQFLRSKLQPNAQGALAPMTPATSSRLYQTIFAPLESSLVGVQRILVVPEGALQSLPFGVLGAGDAKSGQPQWLARRYAFAVLPSVSALRALRTFSHGKPGTDPFVGFGDPVLNGEPGDQRGLGVSQVFTTRSIAASANVSSAALADVDVLRKAKPLPDTADELKALSATLHGSPKAVFLQAQATEARVKQMDLNHYRFLAFATHGVMAGQLSGPAEPGLVLTPPITASALDDGYLSASEVAQLKLNADWVLLSACNTAAPDGTPGAEGLSGLAKAFFYAGSRSLLVSNWPVASKATQVLITTTMKNYIDAPDKGKPEALRTAMLTMMDQPQYSHPFFWAPFSVVGE